MAMHEIRSAYLIGIKGAGMTAIAEILKSRGVAVSGSDTSEVFYTDAILKRQNIPYFETFDADHVPSEVDVIVHSTAYTIDNNVEMSQAHLRALPLKSYPEMLGELFREKLGIAVCGSHGKTTTSAMLGEALRSAGKDPTAVVGSQVISWQSSTLAGAGEYFVAEADEYQNKLKFYDPWSAILTSVDWDHPDFYPDFGAYKQAFKDFVARIPKTGHLVVWGDSADTLEVANACSAHVHSYGFGHENSYRIEQHEVRSTPDGDTVQLFQLWFGQQNLGTFETPLVGKHNVLNSSAVIALCHALGCDLHAVGSALKSFRGTSRRFEQIGFFGNALLIDDYAHHPDEIRATLAGARQRFADKNVWTVFHPHTFTRTKALLQEFAQSFDDADHVVVIDIYGSAREQHGGVSSQELVKLINRYTRNKAEYVPTIDEAVAYFTQHAGSFDVLIAMGAGDVWKIAQRLKDGKQ